MSGTDNQPSDGDSTKSDKTDVNNGGDRTFSQEELGKKLSAERNKLREQFDKELEDKINAAKTEWGKPILSNSGFPAFFALALRCSGVSLALGFLPPDLHQLIVFYRRAV